MLYFWKCNSLFFNTDVYLICPESWYFQHSMVWTNSLNALNNWTMYCPIILIFYIETYSECISWQYLDWVQTWVMWVQRLSCWIKSEESPNIPKETRFLTQSNLVHVHPKIMSQVYRKIMQRLERQHLWLSFDESWLWHRLESRVQKEVTNSNLRKSCNHVYDTIITQFDETWVNIYLKNKKAKYEFGS